ATARVPYTAARGSSWSRSAGAASRLRRDVSSSSVSGVRRGQSDQEVPAMDVDLPEVHARSLEHARRSVAGVADDQWDQLSDCDPWTVRELVNHVVTGNYWAAELGSGLTIEAVGDRLDGDVLGTDPLRGYDDSSIVAAAVFRAPGAMD